MLMTQWQEGPEHQQQWYLPAFSRNTPELNAGINYYKQKQADVDIGLKLQFHCLAGSDEYTTVFSISITCIQHNMSHIR